MSYLRKCWRPCPRTILILLVSVLVIIICFKSPLQIVVIVSKRITTQPQLSHYIINEEWKRISSEAIDSSMFTLPLDNYVPIKSGQPLRAMVGSSIHMEY